MQQTVPHQINFLKLKKKKKPTKKTQPRFKRDGPHYRVYQRKPLYLLTISEDIKSCELGSYKDITESHKNIKSSYQIAKTLNMYRPTENCFNLPKRKLKLKKKKKKIISSEILFSIKKKTNKRQHLRNPRYIKILIPL